MLALQRLRACCPKKAVSLRIPLNYMLLHVDAAQFKE